MDPRNTARKNLTPTKYPRENILDPRNIYEKNFWTHEIPAKKNLRLSKYPREDILEQGSSHEKNFRTHKIPERKNFGLAKYSRETFSDPQKHDDTVGRDP